MSAQPNAQDHAVSQQGNGQQLWEQLLNQVHALTNQVNALSNENASLRTQVNQLHASQIPWPSANNNNSVSGTSATNGQTSATTDRLPEFKMTSRSPPSFNGDSSKLSAHEAQTIINQYLYKAAEEARIYGFLADNETPAFRNHRTYVDWISTGLSGLALSRWSEIDVKTRHSMSWSDFSKWIQREFSSQLTLDDAILALDELKQRGSAKIYSQQFNQLVAAIKVNENEYPVRVLCH